MIYNCVNKEFDLYYNFIEQINDDEVIKRKLESYRNKYIHASDKFEVYLDYYDYLFSDKTGVVIVKGDRDVEGVIERTNPQFEVLFGYGKDELYGTNLHKLMPKCFEENHKRFMKRYVEIGYKTIIDRMNKIIGLDKNQNIVPLTSIVKLLPVLTNNVYFCGAHMNDFVCDLILIDENFMVQGFTKRLLSSLKSKDFFNTFYIPFYIICRKFIAFSKKFLIKERRNMLDLIDKDHDVTIAKSQIYNTNMNNDEDLKDEEVSYAYFDEKAEVNETMEMEFELSVPSMIREYIYKKENRALIRRKELSMAGSSSSIISTEQSIVGGVEEQSYYQNDKTLNIIQPHHDQIDGFDFSVLVDQEKNKIEEIISNTKYYFELGDYKEAELELDKFNSHKSSSSNPEIKFNFTFSVKKFGIGKRCYIVKCVSNKQDFNSLIPSSNNLTKDSNMTDEEIFKNLIMNQQRESNINKKTEQMDRKAEEIAKHRNTDFYKQLAIDPLYFNKIDELKKQILSKSNIFGMKKAQEGNL